MALSERTPVVLSLSHVIGGVVAILLAFGGWLWRLQEQFYELRQDVAVMKAVLAPSGSHASAGTAPAPEPTRAPAAPPIALPDAAVSYRSRDGFHR